MPDTDSYFRAARALMVDSQVRPNNIIDDRIVTAMRTLRRERFVPASLASRAYADTELPLGGGRVLPPPLTIGKLAHFAAIRPGERVLVIGAGTGYGAAVIASCGGAVFALEDDAALRAIAEQALSAEAPEVRLVAGPLAGGDTKHAPFDLIVIEGGVEFLPDTLTTQLAPGGRLIAILYERGIGRIVRAEPSGDGFAHRAVADCHASPLTAFRRKPEFVF
ncbi:protein-L-isoaspartate O-methyltransferase [Acidiphilium sp. AL]|uniref:Protein-L-isoaspartate O-methyltransferase n=1 Tax=Acidiphilium iwatense TaxID=768198 RepID=A0ABS9DZX8_9PROT|nr:MULTISPECIES: protein-L-isoaspartate O-methyltransferase [Acidiphilium]MCF3947643.1 protein-L-isoaspartate O-methyltransferase [Acidiphilium iwatense]MCU4160894.1 protein-L-isoaspartate O-methyltransferase [Acidiphilium sp. AL]